MTPKPEIRFQRTPNPNAGKFTVDRKLVEGRGSKTFNSAAQAAPDPIAAALFEIDGVASVFMVDDFVTVTKSPAVEWTVLEPRVSEVLERVLS
jgi:hypothetical protein